MDDKVNVLSCGRENDLVAFLYGEMNDLDTRNYQIHLQDCRACNSELTTLGKIRELVVEWRNESLGSSSALAADGLKAPAVFIKTNQRKPSALVALREFFDLSPFWMKGAVAFACVLFCLFAVLAVARLRETPQLPVVNNSGKGMYSEQQLNALVERRVQEEIERIKQTQDKEPDSAATVINTAKRNTGKRIVNSTAEVASTSSKSKARRPLTKAERQQLAADLRLLSLIDDTDLDLLGDRLNR
jgi:hypothetical protein